MAGTDYHIYLSKGVGNMKELTREEWNARLTTIPAHLKTVEVAGTIEYYCGMDLVGVLVKETRKNPRVRRLVPTAGDPQT